MIFNSFITNATNTIRGLIQKTTRNIDEGESVAILAWYSFIQDHARVTGHDPQQLAREQLEAFLIEYAHHAKVVVEH